MPVPGYTPPQGYHEVYYLTITDRDKLLWLNMLSIALLLPFIGLMWWWSQVVDGLRSTVESGLQSVPDVVWWLGVILVFPLHEWIHGLAIQWAGHKPRYGAKFVQIARLKLPYVLFATADGVFFRRGQFIVIALAPVVVITLAGMMLLYFLPGFLWNYVIVAVVLNGSGAIGDIWMTVMALRYSSRSLVLDLEDSIRIYEFSGSDVGNSTQNIDPPSSG